MGRLTQNTCVNLATKLANTTANPPRLADLKRALYGGRGARTDEIAYLGQNNAKLSDAWVSKARGGSVDNEKSLTEIQNVFMLTKSF